MNENTQKSAITVRLATLGLVAVWVLAAAWRPTSTYHLAPILIVGVGPMMLWGPKMAVLGATAFGTLVALGTSAILAWLDLLRGPSLLPTGGALVESLVFAGATAVVVVVVAGIPAQKAAH